MTQLTGELWLLAYVMTTRYCGSYTPNLEFIHLSPIRWMPH